MSTSLLYHGWGVRGYQYVGTVYQGGTICFSIDQDADTFCCSKCGSREVIKSGQVWRRFRSLPIGGKRVWIELPIQRLECACGTTRQAKVAFADERRSYTHAFERYALDLSRHMTIKDVAKHLGIGWDASRRSRNAICSAASRSPSSSTSSIWPSMRSASGTGTGI